MEDKLEKRIQKACALYIEEITEISENEKQQIEFSAEFQKRINRLFRERIGSERIPYPEVDNAYERFRSKIMYLYYLLFDRIKRYCKREPSS